VNYRFSLGPTPSIGPDPRDPAAISGAFTYSKTFRPADFADGLSNTIGVSERLQGDWTKGTFRRGGDYLGTSQPSDVSGGPADQAVSFCSSLHEPDSLTDSRGGETWFLSGSTFTLYNHCTTPNSAIHDCAFEFFADTLHGRSLREGVMAATSAHGGSVNGLWMDGSARFVRDSIQLAVWRALGTRSAGEALPAE
jgi:prepilin-type processing-associated H-X9-DG protein